MVTRGRSGEGAGKQMSKEAREVMLRSHRHTRSNKAQKAGQHKWHKRHRSEENRRRSTKRRKSPEADELEEMQGETRADEVFGQMRLEFLQQEGGQLWRLFVCCIKCEGMVVIRQKEAKGTRDRARKKDL
jgi:hypothetical protein